MTTNIFPHFGVYSFADVTAVITAMSGQQEIGNFRLGGEGTSQAEEGITVLYTEETNTQTIGADGSVMNTLHAAMAGTLTTRLLKISPVNYQLAQLYNFQRMSSGTWGNNLIVIKDTGREEIMTCAGCAFSRFPQITYNKAGAVMEWEFHVSVIMPKFTKPSLVYERVTITKENTPTINNEY
jgi:hypothetical protein